MLEKTTSLVIIGAGQFDLIGYGVAVVVATIAVLTVTSVRKQGPVEESKSIAVVRGALTVSSGHIFEMLLIVEFLKSGQKTYTEIRKHLCKLEESGSRSSVTFPMLEELIAEGVVERGPEPGQFRLTRRGRLEGLRP